jgi:hypothetical protein
VAEPAVIAEETSVEPNAAPEEIAETEKEEDKDESKPLV